MRGQPLGIGEQHAADRIERIVDPNAQIFARRFAVRRSLPGIANVAPAQHDTERWCSVAHAVVIEPEADLSLDRERADLAFPYALLRLLEPADTTPPHQLPVFISLRALFGARCRVRFLFFGRIREG